jgi:hypothetical protein
MTDLLTPTSQILNPMYSQPFQLFEERSFRSRSYSVQNAKPDERCTRVLPVLSP